MHEIVLKSIRRPPKVNSPEEKEIKDTINHNIAAVDPLRPFEKIHMNPVRHGAQNNFVPYMWQEEFDEVKKAGGYLKVVAQPGPFPVAVVDNDQWTVLDTEKEWRLHFLEKHIPQPRHWSGLFKWVETLWGLLDSTPCHVLTPEHLNKLKRSA